MRRILGGALLAAVLSTASATAFAAFPVFDQRPDRQPAADQPSPGAAKEPAGATHPSASAGLTLAGGPPPWAPAHGYRRKQAARFHHDDDDDRYVKVPDLGIARGFCNRELVGGIIGGVAGGAIGSQIGDGDTRTVATIGGTIAGVLIGGAIGRRMDDADHACVAHALTEAPAGQAVAWSAPRGDRYRIVPDAFFEDSWGRQCREFRTVAFIDGREQSRKATACRRSDGAWQEIG